MQEADFAERACALVGTRFRAQGRTQAGLDCVGVILRTFGINPAAARRNYRLRGDHRSELEQSLLEEFRNVPRCWLRPGDVMLMRVAEDQFHLGVRTAQGFVHAHAGIGRVVETPGLTGWPVAGVYRKRLKPRRK